MEAVTIFIRKRIEGQNSIEEIANTIAKNLQNVNIKVLPSNGTNILGMIKNILFAIKNQSKINHLISPSDTYIGMFLKGKKIITWHDVETLFQSKSKKRRFLRKLFFLLPTYFYNYVTVISEATRKEIIQYLPHLNKKKIILIPNPLNPNFKPEKKGNLSNPPEILHPGTAKRKNLHKVIAGIAGMNVHLNIIGKLSKEQEDLLRIYKINYSNSYDISTSDMINCYKKADIVIFPSSYEGFGMPIIEGQMTGRPVIISNISPLKEVSGGAAVMLEDLEPETIRNNIENLIKDSSLRQEFINKGLKNAHLYTTERICNLYKSLYERKK